NLADQSSVKASNVRGGQPAYSPKNLFDGDRSTYWSTDDSITTPELTLEFPRSINFNLVRLRENVRLGQRIGEFAVDAWKDGDWSQFGRGTSIGSCRIIRSNDFITTTRVRFRVLQSAACPALSEFGLFSERQ